MPIKFCELAIKHEALTAFEMGAICESEMEYYLCDGENHPNPEEAEIQSKHLKILEFIWREKGGDLATRLQELYLPPDAQNIRVESDPKTNNLSDALGNVNYDREGLNFPFHIKIKEGNCCYIKSNLDTITEIAKAISVKPRDFTAEEKELIQEDPALKNHVSVSFRIRDLVGNRNHWTTENAEFMQKLVYDS